MTQHDPQRCARVAKVMGREARVFGGAGCQHAPYLTSGAYVTANGMWRAFRPDTDPADAWRVLEWFIANAHGDEAKNAWDNMWWLRSDFLAEALMDAVEALGGEE